MQIWGHILISDFQHFITYRVQIMARQWRIEYEGALYHVMPRGNEGRGIASDDDDREMFFSVLGEMSERFEIEVHSCVLKSNHIETSL